MLKVRYIMSGTQEPLSLMNDERNQHRRLKREKTSRAEMSQISKVSFDSISRLAGGYRTTNATRNISFFHETYFKFRILKASLVFANVKITRSRRDKSPRDKAQIFDSVCSVNLFFLSRSRRSLSLDMCLCLCARRCEW